MIVKIDKVLKTDNTWSPEKGTTLTVRMIKTFDGKKCWTFSEQFDNAEGTEVDVTLDDQKTRFVTYKGGGVEYKGKKGDWMDYKIMPIKDEGYSGGQKTFTKSPETQKSIVRQHSQEMALRRIWNEIAVGLLDSKTYTSEVLWKYVDEFEVDAQGTQEKSLESKSKGKDDSPINKDIYKLTDEKPF